MLHTTLMTVTITIITINVNEKKRKELHLLYFIFVFISSRVGVSSRSSLVHRLPRSSSPPPPALVIFTFILDLHPLSPSLSSP
eukprot:m.197391 g.197391  ORF g.197391 m.197391 type:complete len:83 (-) comp16825_c0_seq4:3830-4078(-)